VKRIKQVREKLTRMSSTSSSTTNTTKKSNGKQQQQQQKRTRRTGIVTDAVLAETELRIVDNFRIVRPYEFHFESSAKGRWLGMQLLEMYTENFKGKTREDYQASIDSGRITVNGQPTTADYKIQSNDKLCHIIHRHEPPVRGDSIEIVYQGYSCVFFFFDKSN
jgi:hypothetical protein